MQETNLEIRAIEKAFVGYYLNKPKEIIFIKNKPKPDLFLDQVIGGLYQAMLECQEDFGGYELALKIGIKPDVIADLMTASPITHNMQFWADQLSNLHLANYLRTLCARLAPTKINGANCLEFVRDFQAESDKFTLLKERTTNLLSWQEASESWAEELQEKATGSLSPIMTGFPELDDVIDGFHPAELYVFAAATGTGKSALLKSLLISAMKKNPKLVVLVLSVEMTPHEIKNRISAELCGLDAKEFRKGKFSSEDFDKIYESEAKTFDWNIQFSRTTGISISDIRSLAKACKIMHGLDMVIVDYIQRMRPHNPKLSKLDNLTEISFGLKQLALDFNVPVLAAAQVGSRKEKEGRVNYKLSDIADCGGIGYDADTVIFIERPYKMDPLASKTMSHLVVKKNRHGEENASIEVEFHGHVAGFAPKSKTR